MTFHLTCAHIIFRSVRVAESPPFGKQLLSRLTICSLCITCRQPNVKNNKIINMHGVLRQAYAYKVLRHKPSTE